VTTTTIKHKTELSGDNCVFYSPMRMLTHQMVYNWLQFWNLS